MNANLQHKSGTGCGCTELQADAACSEHGVVSFLRSLLVDEEPTVTVTSGSDGMSAGVAEEYGRTAMTPAEWDDLAAGRGDERYVLVDTAPGRRPYVSPPRSYADARAEFDREMAWPTRDRDYRPHTGRALKVMSEADYLKARESWGQR